MVRALLGLTLFAAVAVSYVMAGMKCDVCQALFKNLDEGWKKYTGDRIDVYDSLKAHVPRICEDMFKGKDEEKYKYCLGFSMSDYVAGGQPKSEMTQDMVNLFAPSKRLRLKRILYNRVCTRFECAGYNGGIDEAPSKSERDYEVMCQCVAADPSHLLVRTAACSATTIQCKSGEEVIAEVTAELVTKMNEDKVLSSYPTCPSIYQPIEKHTYTSTLEGYMELLKAINEFASTSKTAVANKEAIAQMKKAVEDLGNSEEAKQLKEVLAQLETPPSKVEDVAKKGTTVAAEVAASEGISTVLDSIPLIGNIFNIGATAVHTKMAHTMTKELEEIEVLISCMNKAQATYKQDLPFVSFLKHWRMKQELRLQLKAMDLTSAAAKIATSGPWMIAVNAAQLAWKLSKARQVKSKDIVAELVYYCLSDSNKEEHKKKCQEKLPALDDLLLNDDDIFSIMYKKLTGCKSGIISCNNFWNVQYQRYVKYMEQVELAELKFSEFDLFGNVDAAEIQGAILSFKTQKLAAKAQKPAQTKA